MKQTPHAKSNSPVKTRHHDDTIWSRTEKAQEKPEENTMEPHQFIYWSNGDAKKVSLAGDFSNWTPINMTKRKDAFRATINLSPGEYQYKFLVDGQWRDDPLAERTVPNGMGGTNSVVHVKQETD